MYSDENHTQNCTQYKAKLAEKTPTVDVATKPNK